MKFKQGPLAAPPSPLLFLAAATHFPPTRLESILETAPHPSPRQHPSPPLHSGRSLSSAGPWRTILACSDAPPARFYLSRRRLPLHTASVTPFFILRHLLSFLISFFLSGTLPVPFYIPQAFLVPITGAHIGAFSLYFVSFFFFLRSSIIPGRSFISFVSWARFVFFLCRHV